MTQFDFFSPAMASSSSMPQPKPYHSSTPSISAKALIPPPFQKKSETSLAAADAMTKKAPALRAKVLAALREAGSAGLTDTELSTKLSMMPQTAIPRRGELVKMGSVVKSGRTRKTPSGCSATVWVATEFA